MFLVPLLDEVCLYYPGIYWCVQYSGPLGSGYALFVYLRCNLCRVSKEWLVMKIATWCVNIHRCVGLCGLGYWLCLGKIKIWIFSVFPEGQVINAEVVSAQFFPLGTPSQLCLMCSNLIIIGVWWWSVFSWNGLIFSWLEGQWLGWFGTQGHISFLCMECL